MTHRLAVAALLFAGLAGADPAQAQPPIRDPAFLNIGFVCQWQQKCIGMQKHAMDRALGFVRKQRPPEWRVQQCNRNASRYPLLVDWVGYDHCIRNPVLQYAPPPVPARAHKPRRRRLSHVRSVAAGRVPEIRQT
jgi:hypothetical protein